MNRKVLFVAVALTAGAMLALQVSAVWATKPEAFVFYGWIGSNPGAYSTWSRDGKSDNWFGTWTDFPYGYSTGYIPTQTGFIPTGIFATGFYDGHWTAHEATGVFQAEKVTGEGVTALTFTKWEGKTATGNAVIRGTVGEHARWVLSGTINGKAVHGEGVCLPEIGILLIKYEGTIHFDP